MEREKTDTQASEQRIPKKSPRRVSSNPDQIGLSEEERHHLISEMAYFRAEQRGFAPGEELSDWLAAEAQINEWLRQSAIVKTTKASGIA